MPETASGKTVAAVTAIGFSIRIVDSGIKYSISAPGAFAEIASFS